MRRTGWIFLGSLLLAACGCGKIEPPMKYEPFGSIRDVMDGVVDPNAQYLWNSVATIVTADGTEKRFPKTDDDWQTAHEHSVALVEATNLLLIPNRHVARPGEKADNPDIERSPQAIEGMMSRDRATFLNRISGLRAAALQMQAAVDAKSVEGIEDAGVVLDRACENCHMTYWYLPDKPSSAK